MKKKLKGIVVAAATLALAAVMLAGCSGGGDAQKSDEGKAGDAPFTLTVGFDQGYPPYGYVGDDGQFTGFDLELAKAVCETDGLGAEAGAHRLGCEGRAASAAAPSTAFGTASPWKTARTTTRSPSRICYNEQVVVVKKDSGAKNLEDLAGKTVLTQVDSAALHVLENDNAEEGGQAALAATFKELQTIGDYNNAFMQLESGMVDAVACDLSIASFQMAAKPDAYVKLGVLAPRELRRGLQEGRHGAGQAGDRRPQGSSTRRASSRSCATKYAGSGHHLRQLGSVSVPAACRPPRLLDAAKPLTHPASPLFRLPSRAASTLGCETGQSGARQRFSLTLMDL